MGDIAAWFNSVPPFTRYWFGGTVALSLIGRFHLMNAYYFLLYYQPLVHSFQFWRIVTCLFYYPMGMHFLFNLYFIIRFSGGLESDDFARRPADFCFMLLFFWLCSIITALFGGFPLIMDIVVMAVLYVWSQLNKDTMVSFWFGLTFKAMYLPWVLFAFNFIVYGNGTFELIGIILGHLYYFLSIKYPQDFGGPSLLNTPQILYDYLPNQAGVSGFGQAPTAPRRAGGGGGGGGAAIFRGQGHTLG